MLPEQKLPSLDGVKVVALVSVGAHPTSGRARRAEQDARAVELGLRLVGDKLRVLHAGDPAEEALRGYLGMGVPALLGLGVLADWRATLLVVLLTLNLAFAVSVGFKLATCALGMARLHRTRSERADSPDGPDRTPGWDITEADLPTYEGGGMWARLVAGEAFGAKAAVRTQSPLFYVHWELQPGAKAQLPAEYPERAAYIATGSVEIDEEAYTRRYDDGLPEEGQR